MYFSFWDKGIRVPKILICLFLWVLIQQGSPCMAEVVKIVYADGSIEVRDVSAETKAMLLASGGLLLETSDSEGTIPVIIVLFPPEGNDPDGVR